MYTQMVYKHMLCNETLNIMFMLVMTIVSSPNPPSELILLLLLKGRRSRIRQCHKLLVVLLLFQDSPILLICDLKMGTKRNGRR